VNLKEEGISQELSNKTWVIEDATWRDFTQLFHLQKICFTPDDLWPFWDLIGILTLPGMVRLKAVIDDHMVGFLGGEKQPARKIGWITNIAVMPAYRRLGIARALLAECEESFSDMRAVRLSVRATNNAAIQLYEGFGYELVDRRKRYYTGGEDALVFEKSR
jgi:ribosomal-protein-alanine N-acetyltransferase